MVIEGDPPTASLTYEVSRSAEFGECSEEDAAWAFPQIRPQPVVPFGEPVQIPEGTFDEIPRAYVICTRDRSIPPALQRRMVAENGIEDAIEIDTDHSPMISRPAELAEAVDQLVTRALGGRRWRREPRPPRLGAVRRPRARSRRSATSSRTSGRSAG